MSFSSGRKAYGGISDQFPAGLRVLVVDDDPICLMILERMLRNCLYEVTTCSRAVVALSMLRERKGGFDLVISDVYMPDMDGFKLLEHIGLEMDLPVIMMSADDGKDVVMKGVTHGACDYLIKPVRIEAIKNIWQHVVRKKRNELKEVEQSVSMEDSEKARKLCEDAEYASSANEESWRYLKKRKDIKDEEDDGENHEDSSTLKKPRVVWTVELHQQFVTAVNQLGIDKAVPKKILELMNVPALTRENVASHLQKYRSYLRRINGPPQQQSGVSTSFGATSEASFGSLSSLDELELQKSLGISNQLPQQNMVANQAGTGRTAVNTSMGAPFPDQLSPFSSRVDITNASKMANRLTQQGNEKANLLHALPITMDPKHLLRSHWPVQSFENMSMQAPQGSSGFLTLPTSLRASSSSLRDIDNENPTSPLTTEATEQQQSQSTRRLLNEKISGNMSEIQSSIGRQLFSNELVSRFLASNGRNASFRGSGLNNRSYTEVPRALPIDYTQSHYMELPGNGFTLPSTAGLPSFASKGTLRAIPEMGSLEELEDGSSLKGLTGMVPSCNNLHEYNGIRKHEWELQNSNIAYDVAEHINSLQGDPDFGTSALDHQHRSAHLGSKENVLLQEENECVNGSSVGRGCNNSEVDNSFRVKPGSVRNFSSESMLPNESFPQVDLLNAVLKQQQEGLGLGEAEFNFDGYSVYKVTD